MHRRYHRLHFGLFILCLALTLNVSAQQPQKQPLAVIPFELNTNHIHIKVTINDQPANFILDTGAAMSVMAMEKAKAMELKMEGTVGIGGAGSEGGTAGSFVQNARLKMDGLEGFTTGVQIALPLIKIAQSESRNVDGILGAEFFRRYVVQIDYPARQLNVFDPETYQYNGSGAVLPLTFKHNHPHINIQIQAENGELIDCDTVVDTGARSALILARPFVEEHNLLKLTPKTFASSAIGAGLNGISKGILGRLKTVRLGSIVIEHPVTTFSQDTQGVFASTSVLQGNIGGEILRRFRVTFDYKRKQMMLEPTAELTTPYEFDMSGLFLRSDGAEFKTIRIERVQENAPAGEAGIQAGDELLSINGKPVAQFTLESIRQMFRKDQTKCTLKIKREEKVITVKMTTRRLI